MALEKLRMTEDEIICYLEDSGFPEHIVRGGSAGLIRRWAEFAQELEEGYRYRLEDYRHDLDFRGILSQLELDADPRVEAADTQVKGLLTHTDIRVWESLNGNPFWDFGYPANAALVIRDLQKEGLLAD